MPCIKRNLDEIVIFEIDEHVASSKIAGKTKDFLMENLNGTEQYIIVDCRKISYIDTVFLGAMVFALKRRASKAKVSFVNDDMENQIWTIFEANNLKLFFNVFSNLEEAVSWFHNPGNGMLKMVE